MCRFPPWQVLLENSKEKESPLWLSWVRTDFISQGQQSEERDDLHHLTTSQYPELCLQVPSHVQVGGGCHQRATARLDTSQENKHGLPSIATTLVHVRGWGAGAPLPVSGQLTFFKTEEQSSVQEVHIATLPSTVHHCLLITHQLRTGICLCG